MKVFITIDTEEDDWGSYRTGDFSLENITRLPWLQGIFDRYRAKPTYLISYPVAAGPVSQRILSKLVEDGCCEIGAHCHPWNTPPFEEEITERNSMLCNLPAELVNRKTEVLHETIIDTFGVNSRSFRTGRWGFGENVARAVYRLGYEIDTSVTPFVDWTEYQGPDFSRTRAEAYRFDPGDVMCRKADGLLLEVPATTGFYQERTSICSSARRAILSGPMARLRLIGLLDKLGLVNFRWLSPELSSGAEMVRLARTMMKLGSSFLNMSFHSTTLLPGKSPFVRDEADLGRFIANIEEFLQFAGENGMTFALLSESPNLSNSAVSA